MPHSTEDTETMLVGGVLALVVCLVALGSIALHLWRHYHGA